MAISLPQTAFAEPSIINLLYDSIKKDSAEKEKKKAQQKASILPAIGSTVLLAITLGKLYHLND
ncbi:MAG: hypothetical protein ACK5T0_03785 [Vampirovibrionales bacterium]